MKLTSHTHTSTTHTFTIEDGDENITIESTFPVADHIDPFRSPDSNTIVVALENPHGIDSEHEWPEGVEFVQANPRYFNHLPGDEVEHWTDRLIGDHDVFEVDVYEHGNILYSLGGGGPQCQFDTSHGGARIAIPNDRHENPYTDTRQAAANILAEYSAWCNGEGYGIVSFTYEDGEWVEGDAVWGFFGSESVQSTINSGGY